MTTSTGSTSHIAVVGTGYVGLTTGACLGHLGHTVVCADIDERKIEQLRAGLIPIVEDGVGEMVSDGLAAGRLSFVLGAASAAEDADIVFLCVPTPQDNDGSADLSFVEAAAREIGPVLRAGAIVVNKSTVPVGSTIVVEQALGRDDVSVVSNPEFLREGSAVHDFMHPDRVVIGADDQGAAKRVANLYAGIDTEVIITDPASAETIKYAANSFLAMKISFINAIAAMCEAVGADIASVVEGIGSDRRIGRTYLNPGPGWGGSCFPKDSRALVKIAAQSGYDFALMRGVIDANDEQHARMLDKVFHAVGRHSDHHLVGVTIGALGLTFKAGTDDLRESPALHILGTLRGRGAEVQAYDPTTSAEISTERRNQLMGIDTCASPIDAARNADVLVLLTEWPEFAELDLNEIAGVMSNPSMVDTRNMLDGDAVRAAGFEYDGVGRR